MLEIKIKNLSLLGLILIVFLNCKSDSNNRKNEIKKSNDTIGKNVINKDIFILKNSDTLTKFNEKITKNNCIKDKTKFSKFLFSIDDNQPMYYKYAEEIEPFFLNAKKYKGEAIDLLTCINLKDFQKFYLVCVMNGLPFKENIDFIDKSYSLYKEKKISKSRFVSIFYNTYGHRYFIEKYYNKKPVIKLLNKVKKDSTLVISENISGYIKSHYIDRVLSGDAWRTTKKYYSDPVASPKVDLDSW